VTTLDQLNNATADPWPNILNTTGITLTAWSLLLTGANIQSVAAVSAVAKEWQDFVSHRLKEDVEFLQRLTRSTGPEQIVSVYAEFWRKAGEEYTSEIGTMMKLATGMTNDMAIAAQSVTEEASTRLLYRKAA
jgi:Phasin protein